MRRLPHELLIVRIVQVQLMHVWRHAQVIDVQSGDAVGPGKDGEICINSPSVMCGYANNAAATADTIDKDGWLHTGKIPLV